MSALDRLLQQIGSGRQLQRLAPRNLAATHQQTASLTQEHCSGVQSLQISCCFSRRPTYLSVDTNSMTSLRHLHIQCDDNGGSANTKSNLSLSLPDLAQDVRLDGLVLSGKFVLVSDIGRWIRPLGQYLRHLVIEQMEIFAIDEAIELPSLTTLEYHARRWPFRCLNCPRLSEVSLSIGLPPKHSSEDHVPILAGLNWDADRVCLVILRSLTKVHKPKLLHASDVMKLCAVSEKSLAGVNIALDNVRLADEDWHCLRSESNVQIELIREARHRACVLRRMDPAGHFRETRTSLQADGDRL